MSNIFFFLHFSAQERRLASHAPLRKGGNKRSFPLFLPLVTARITSWPFCNFSSLRAAAAAIRPGVAASVAAAVHARRFSGVLFFAHFAALPSFDSADAAFCIGVFFIAARYRLATESNG